MKIDTEILCSFIDGELDTATATAVRTALDTDENLRQEYEDLRKTAELVRGLPKVSAPAQIAEVITANAERDQLMGRTVAAPVSAGRSRLYWGLSMAASLLIGAAVGILAYHSLQSKPESPTGPVLVTSEKTEPGDLSDMFRGGRADSPALPSSALVRDGRITSKESGDEIAALTKSDRGITSAKGKSRIRITPQRSGPPGGELAKSVGRVVAGPGMSPPDEEQLATARQTGAIATTEKSQRELEYAGENRKSQFYDMELPVKGAAADAFRGDIEAQDRLKVAGKAPLETQVLSNNFISQDMTVNLKFEAEPLNIKVVSNDTSKTLQYVQQWAASNSLIDLNKASSKINFPVYTQVFYRGKPGSNIEPANEKGILLRTTRSQARQIVAELQEQRPVVVSVAVKDEKNSLGLDSHQLQRAGLSVVARRRLGGEQGQPVLAGRLATEAPQAKSSLEEDKDLDGSAGTSGKFVDQQARALPSTLAETGTGYYLSQITNQMQAVSLDDLVTLVVLVEDARQEKSNIKNQNEK